MKNFITHPFILLFLLMTHKLKPDPITQKKTNHSTTTQASTPLTCEGISYHTNRFGDIFPAWDTIPEQQLTHTLAHFVDSLKPHGAPFIIEIPHSKASAIPFVQDAGFTLRCADNEKTVWIIINGSPIPAAYTATGSALVMVLDQDHILVIEEKTRPGILGFPAGNADRQEFIKRAAARELKEEVGLNAQANDLTLFAVINRLNVNPQGASNYTHCYFVDKNKINGEISIDNKEIVRALWIPLAILGTEQLIEGLKVAPFINQLAHHVYYRCAQAQSLTIADERQLEAPIQNTLDVMQVELLAQNLE